MTADTEVRAAWPPRPEALPSPVVDNHCHLDHRIKGGLLLDVPQALAEASASNVTRIVQVGCDVDSSRWAVQAAEDYDEIVAAVALHPNDAARLDPDDLPEALEAIERLAA